MKIKNLLLMIFLISLLPQLTLAESKPHTVTFTLGGGYIFFAPKRDLQNTGIPAAAAIAYNFTEKWAMEFAMDLLNANSGNPPQHHVHGWIYLLDALYRFHPCRYVEPYLIAGMNVISLKPSISESVNQGGMNAGIGAEFFKHHGFALSAEARDIYTFVHGKNDILLNFGVNFMWE